MCSGQICLGKGITWDKGIFSHTLLLVECQLDAAVVAVFFLFFVVFGLLFENTK